MKKIYLVLLMLFLGMTHVSISQTFSSDELFKMRLFDNSEKASCSVSPNDENYGLFLKAMDADSAKEKLMLLNKFIESCPENELEDAYTYKGLAFCGLSLYDSALYYFNAAINFNQKDPYLYYFRGDTYSHMHNYVKAIEDFSHAIKLDQSFYMAFYFRGICNYALGNVNKAIEDFSRTFRLVKASMKTA